MELFAKAETDAGLSREEIKAHLLRSLEGRTLKNVLSEKVQFPRQMPRTFRYSYGKHQNRPSSTRQHTGLNHGKEDAARKPAIIKETNTQWFM